MVKIKMINAFFKIINYMIQLKNVQIIIVYKRFKIKYNVRN